MANATKTTPIRLIFAHGDNADNGLTFIYEIQGGVGKLFVDYKDPVFEKIRFTDEGESRIVWASAEIKRTLGGTRTKEWVQEIHVRRDFQTNKR